MMTDEITTTTNEEEQDGTSSHLLKVFASPERYVQGPNAMKYLGNEMKKLNMKGPVLVVSSETPRTLLEEIWRSSLKENGYDEIYYHSFGGICSDHESKRIVAAAEAIDAKTLIGIGGGQVIDSVRTASIKIPTPCEVVSCPTIASTDAPCSTLCVLYHENEQTGNKEFHEYRFTKRHPTLVLVDTTVIANAPRRLLVGGLGDALATYFEARTIKEANEKTFLGAKQTETAFAVAKLSYDILLQDGLAAIQAVENKQVTPELERVVEANTLLSGLGFESGGLCVAHSVHNGLTTQSDCMKYYTHGERVAFGLLTQLVLEEKHYANQYLDTTNRKDEIDIILKFCTTVGLPVTLKELSIDGSNDDKVIREIARRALAKEESSHREPFDITVDMMMDAIRNADRLGTHYLKGIKAKKNL